MPYTTLITTDVLAGELNRTPAANVVLVDCRYDLANDSWGAEQYRAAHLPGAVYASLSHDLSAEPSAEKPGRNGRHPIPPIADMEATFSRLGIGDGTQVVAYDQDTGMFASRLWWMLRYLGHDAVAVLDGGWARWTREGRSTEAGERHNRAAAFEPRPRDAWRLTARDVERVLADRSALLVDARGPERFEGRSEPLDRVAGHIPGARNHYFRDNVAADGTMRPIEALKASFAPLLEGRTPEQVVMYCGSGVSACHNLLALEHAGVSGVRLYPGSWSEWSADPARPVETGPARTADEQ